MSDQQFPEFTQPGQKPKINSIFDFSAEALGQLRLWLEQNPPAIGINNILGFSQFTAKTTANVNNQDTTVSTSYTDLANVGPTLTGLADGQYLILMKCVLNPSINGDAALANVSVNGSTPTDGDSVINFNSSAGIGCMSWTVQTLSNKGNNTIKMVYRSNAGASTATFSFRQLAALKFANA